MLTITRIETIPLEIPWSSRIRQAMTDLPGVQSWPIIKTHICRVYTNEGLVGLAEGLGPPPADMERYIGHSPFEYIQDDESRWLMIAFYDLMAQALGLPVYKLFGPRVHDRMPIAYWSHSFPPALMASEAVWAYEHGFRLHKIKARHWLDPIEQARAMAEVTPPDYRITVDPNTCWQTVAYTRRIARQYEAIPQIVALEEPIPRFDHQGYRELRATLPYPIAVHAGSNTYVTGHGGVTTLDSTASLVDECDAFVLEISTLGRIQAAIVGLAEAHAREIWMENGLHTGISAAFQLHQAATYPNAEIMIDLTAEQEDDLVTEPLPMENGMLLVPEKPGLGVTLDEEALARYRVDK